MQGKVSYSPQNFFKEQILNRWYLVLPAILLFIYIALRAAKLSLVWDEANTFFEYVRTPNWLPRDYNYMSANNHLLNTWLMKCSVNLFGESEFALRLPNVLSSAFYFFAIAAILEKLFERRLHILLAFAILALNPFTLDFFSVARGYGISLALMMGGLLQITKYIFGKHELRHGIYAQLFLVAATVANLTMIHILLAISFLLIINRFLFHRNERPARALLFFTTLPLVTIIILLPYIHHLKIAGALFYGDEAKSLADTFLSLSQASFYGAFYSSVCVPVMTILVSAIPLVSIIYLMRNAQIVMKTNRGRWIVFITMTLFFTIAGPMFLHFIFKTNFLSGRTALFYLPLIILNFLGLVMISPVRLRNFILVFTGSAAFLHFTYMGNIYDFYDYREQADVKEAMTILKKQIISGDQKVYAQVISTDVPYEKQINYYRMRFGMNNFSHASRKESVPACSYYYLPLQSDEFVNIDNDPIHTFDGTMTELYRMKQFPGSDLKLVSQVWEDFERQDSYLDLKTDTVFFGNRGAYAEEGHEYSVSVPLSIPDSVSGNLVASLNCRLYYYTRNTSALLVFSFDNGSAETWEAMHFTELTEKPGQWSLTNWTRPIPKGTKTLRVYLWNRDKTPVLMDNVGIRLLKAGN
ncbi:MAG TPA: hypothetical protein VFJ43_12305 [Bacteroidia bacterium]|nr:hypothetical protein [Bacteroidia bacterium]